MSNLTLLSSLVSSEVGLKFLMRGMLNFKYLHISTSVGHSFFPVLEDLHFIYFMHMVEGHVYDTVYVCRSDNNM